MSPAAAGDAAPPRALALDWIRGAAVLGMWVVNFLGGYRATPEALRHHDAWMSVADAVMPLFFFAAGAAARAGVLARGGVDARRAARRVLGLFLLGAAVYVGPDIWEGASLLPLAKRSLFQTLVHLAATTLATLPVIAAAPRARLAWIVGSAALHQALLHAFALDWAFAEPRVIDGGPLGFLTWTIPYLGGSLAWDAVRDAPPGGAPLGRMAALGLLLAGAGFAASRFSGGHDALMQSQRAGTTTYLVAATGTSLALFALALRAERAGCTAAPLRTLGRNALLGYLAEPLLQALAAPVAPGPDASLARAALACGALVGAGFVSLRLLERRGIYLRL